MLVAAREHPKDGRGKNTMKLIIAEKPSLARNIVAGIESFNDYKMRRGVSCNLGVRSFVFFG